MSRSGHLRCSRTRTPGAKMLLSLLVTPVLAAIMIVGSIAVMVGIIRRSVFVPLLAVVIGTVGVLFSSTPPVFSVPAAVLSLLVLPLGVAAFVLRRRAERVEKAGDTGSRDRDYLADSGRWRLRPS